MMITAEPLPLMDLCRRVIRQNINKERIERGKIAELSLPKTIKDYLEYKDRRPLNNQTSATCWTSPPSTSAAATSENENSTSTAGDK